MEAVKKARLLTQDISDEQTKVEVIYNFLVTNFIYDLNKAKTLPLDYRPNIESVYINRAGMCYDFSSLFAAMLRSIDIPTKMVMGYSENVNGYHAWNEVFNSRTGYWTVFDTSYDSQMRALDIPTTMYKEASLYTKLKDY